MSGATNKNYFQFYQDFWDSIEKLPEKKQLSFYRKVIKYGLFGEADDVEISFKNDTDESLFQVLKGMIDNQIRRRQQLQENGKKGGAPSGNKNASRDDPNCPLI